MTRGIFIAGNESAISRAVENETVNRVEKYAAAFIPNRLSGTSKNIPAANKKRLPLEWNPSSPISARTMILAAENRLDKIDEAILICSPPSMLVSAPDIPLSDVEVMINDNIKGWFFLVKELSAVFKNRKRGTLALVYPEPSTDAGTNGAADILGHSCLASFGAFTKDLLAAAGNDPYITAGFSCSGTGNEQAFASFIFKTIDDTNKRTSGKLHKWRYSALRAICSKLGIRLIA
jgi:NAD(P)-dependent dehydrogenase (short-subunit alcohol dehydrogenase family)